MRSGKFRSFQNLVDWWKGAPRQTERPKEPAALERIKAFLGQEGIPYRAVLHPEASGKLQSAGPMRPLRREVVKVEIVHTEEEYGMAVLPSRLDFDLARFARMIEVRRIYPVEEQKRKEIFDDCALRELPAFGNLYGLPVYLDESLTWEPVLLLRAGSHREVIEMRYEDYDRAVHPIIGHYVLELKRAGGA